MQAAVNAEMQVAANEEKAEVIISRRNEDNRLRTGSAAGWNPTSTSLER